MMQVGIFELILQSDLVRALGNTPAGLNFPSKFNDSEASHIHIDIDTATFGL